MIIAKQISMNKEEPFFVWAFVEGKPSIPLKKTSASVWNSSPTVYDDCIYSSFLYDRLWKERLSLTFWMDFGSTELRSNTRKINQLTSLFTNQTLCDVTFTFQQQRQETFGAHTIILSSQSCFRCCVSARPERGQDKDGAHREIEGPVRASFAVFNSRRKCFGYSCVS